MSGVADTAKLLASLDLQDQMSPKLKGAISTVGQAESGIASLGSKVTTFASNLKGAASNAIGHFQGRLSQLASMGAGLLGVGGILGIGALFKSGIEEAKSFGDEVMRLSKLTGLSVATTSALASALHHFGIDGAKAAIIAGMAEKNLSNLTKTQKTATKFQKDYRLSLLGSNGQVLTFDKLLLRTADYFNNKSIPAQTKAAALQKLYGRSWQDLIPVLSAGSKGIAAAEEEAKRLGLTLTQDNIVALQKSKEATRDWGTALGGLKLQIGLVALPLLTELVKTATAFVTAHRGEIIGVFRAIVGLIQKVPAFFHDQVLPIVNKIKSAWDALPQGVKDILVKGLIADRTVKFLFGFSPVGAAVGGLLDVGQVISQGVGSALGNVLSGSVQEGLTKVGLGRLFIQPVFVTNKGFGLPGGEALGGLLPAAGGAAGTGLGMTVAAAITAVGAGLGLAAILALAAELVIKYGKDPTNVGGRTDTATARGLPVSGLDPNFTGPRSAAPYGSYRPPAGAMSLGDRDLRAPLLAANSKLQDIKDISQTTRAEAKIYATNAAGDRARWLAALSARMDMTNSKLESIKDKDQSVHVAVHTQIPITIYNAGSRSEAGATIHRTVTRDGTPVAI